MFVLQPLPHDPIDDYDAVSAAKHAATQLALSALRPQIVSANSAFATTLGRPASQVPCSIVNGDILRENYLNPTKPLASLKVVLADLVGSQCDGLCPYCLAGEARVYDHNLPKEEYPEFSVNHLNLIRSCNSCNEYKGASVGMVVNSYYATLPVGQWLFAHTAARPRISVLYEFSFASMTNDAQAFLAHAKQLKLRERYRRGTTELMSEVAAWCGRLNRRQLQSRLRSASRDYASRLGPNYWKSVGLKALADSRECLDAIGLKFQKTIASR